VSEARLNVATERLRLIDAFGEKLREHRKAAHLSETRLAERARLSVSTISKTELGRGGEPSLSLILILCEALAISPNALLNELPTPHARRTQR
jgi:transcriptional regulator with XRE-family HTH domain